MKEWIKRWFGAWSAEPLDVEVTLADVMSQLDPGWEKWARSFETRLFLQNNEAPIRKEMADAIG